MAPESQITTAPEVLWPQDPSLGPASLDTQVLNGQIPNEWLGRRALTDCDGVGIFKCPIGTCYTGLDGFIGCCSVSSCAARTTCIEYKPGRTVDCDINTGGCERCRAAAPYCNTITNILEDQYIIYCDTTATVETLSYSNLVTSGSTAGLPAPAAASSSQPGAMTPGAVATVTVTSTSTGGDETSSASRSTSFSASPSTFSSVSSSASSSSSESAIEKSSPSSPAASKTLSPGAIAGISVGGVAVLALVAFLIFWFCIRQKLLARHQNRRAGKQPEKYTSLFSNTEPYSGPWGMPQEPGSRPSQLDSKEVPRISLRSEADSEPPWSPRSIISHQSSPELNISPIHSAPNSPPSFRPAFSPPISIDDVSSYRPYDPYIARPISELPTSSEYSIEPLTPSNEVSRTGASPAIQLPYLSAEMALSGGYVEVPSTIEIPQDSDGVHANRSELGANGEQHPKECQDVTEGADSGPERV